MLVAISDTNFILNDTTPYLPVLMDQTLKHLWCVIALLGDFRPISLDTSYLFSGSVESGSTHHGLRLGRSFNRSGSSSVTMSQHQIDNSDIIERGTRNNNDRCRANDKHDKHHGSDNGRDGDDDGDGAISAAPTDRPRQPSARLFKQWRLYRHQRHTRALNRS